MSEKACEQCRHFWDSTQNKFCGNSMTGNTCEAERNPGRWNALVQNLFSPRGYCGRSGKYWEPRAAA